MAKANTNESLEMLRGKCTELELEVGIETSKSLVQLIFNINVHVPEAWDRSTDLTGEYEVAEDLKEA